LVTNSKKSNISFHRLPFNEGWGETWYAPSPPPSPHQRRDGDRKRYQFGCLKSHSKIPPHLPLQREEKYFPLLTKGDEGGLDVLS